MDIYICVLLVLLLLPTRLLGAKVMFDIVMLEGGQVQQQ